MCMACCFRDIRGARLAGVCATCPDQVQSSGDPLGPIIVRRRDRQVVHSRIDSRIRRGLRRVGVERAGPTSPARAAAVVLELLLEQCQFAVELRIAPAAFIDGSDRVHHRRVIAAAEVRADLLEAEPCQVPGEVHADLPRMRDRLRPAADRRSVRRTS